MEGIMDIDCRKLRKYRKLDCDSIREYLKEEEFRKLVTVIDKYAVTVQHTLAIFDFSDDPIDGIYKTLIVDLKHHFVLTPASSRVVVNSIYTNISLAGYVFQRNLNNELKHKYLNVISLGYSAFFSLKGYSNGNTHWVALHHIKHYKHSTKQGIIQFSTFELGNTCFKFTYKSKAHIKERLHNSIIHNNVVRKALKNHLLHNLGIEHQPIKHTRKSLLYNCKHRTAKKEIRDIVHELITSYIIKTHYYTKNSDEEHKEMSYICHMMTRDRFNY